MSVENDPLVYAEFGVIDSRDGQRAIADGDAESLLDGAHSFIVDGPGYYTDVSEANLGALVAIGMLLKRIERHFGPEVTGNMEGN